MGSSVVSPCYAVTCGLLEVSYLSSRRPLVHYRMAFLYFLQCEVAVSQTSRRHFFPAVAAAGWTSQSPVLSSGHSLSRALGALFSSKRPRLSRFWRLFSAWSWYSDVSFRRSCPLTCRSSVLLFLMLICLASLTCPQERGHQRPSQRATATFTSLGPYSDSTGPRHRVDANHHFHCIQLC